MATSGNTSSNGYQGRYIYFEWWTKSVSSANNTRTIGYKFTAKGGSSSIYYHHNNVFQLNGETVYSGGSSVAVKTDTVLAQGDYTINQSSTNKLRVDMDGGIYSYGDNINTADEWTLDDIPRYATLTSLGVKSRTVNSITFSFTSDKACRIYAKIVSPITTNWLNNGNPFKDNVTSGDFTINYKDVTNSTRLDPNTKYKFQILCRNYVSQLDTSKEIEATTLDIAKLVSVPNVNIGSKQTITWTNPSGATTSLKLCKTDNSQIANIGTVTGTSKSYTATASTIYALTPNSNTYKARYILTTTQNGQSYTNSKDFNFVVTNSNPTFSNFTYQDTNATTIALTGSNQILVKGYSKVKAIVSAANKAIAKNSATMKTYKLVIGSQSTTNNYSSTADVSLPSSGALSVDSGTLTMYATDSRTNSTPVTKNATYKQYSDLTIKSVTAVRDNNGVGKGVTLSFNGSYWAQSFGKVTNTIKSVIYQYRNSNSSTWHTGTTTLTYTQSNGNYSGSLKIRGEDAEGFNISNSYVIRLTIKDELSTKTYDVTLSSGTPAIAIYKSNVAIGQKYDSSLGGVLQTSGSIQAKSGLIQVHSGSSHVSMNGAGGIEISHSTTPYIDFHYGNSTENYTSRLYESVSGTLNIVKNLIIGGGLTSHNIFANGYIGQNAGTISTSSTTNFDTALREGEFNVGGSNIIGAPHTGNIYGKLIIKVNDGGTHNNQSNWIWQFFLEANNKIYKRNKVNNGSWSVWSEIRDGIITGYKTLYSNTSGTTGSITLNESAANFSFLEIFYGDSSHILSTKVFNPNGKKTNLAFSYWVNNLVNTQFIEYSISNTNMTRATNGYYFNSSEQGTANDIKVFNVMGYR